MYGVSVLHSWLQVVKLRLDKQEKSQGDRTQQALDELRTTTFHKVHEREGEWVGGREGGREGKEGGEYTCIHVCTLYLESFTNLLVHVYMYAFYVHIHVHEARAWQCAIHFCVVVFLLYCFVVLPTDTIQLLQVLNVHCTCNITAI